MLPGFYFLLITIVSLLLVLIIMPSVLHIAKQNNLFDDHSLSRKEHGYGIPRLGGIAFFLSFILTSLFIIKNGTDLPMYNFYAASIILFGVGIKDDLSGVHIHTKLIVQAVAAFIIAVPGDIRITNLQGIFGIYQLNFVSSALVSILLMMFVINSFNLIDGIDGLAGTLAVIACCTFGCYFLLTGELVLTALALSLAGSLIAFLAYNYSPSKIFMGDGGSLFLGLACAVFAIKFISINEASAVVKLQDASAFAVAVLIIPVFDTFSVIVTRISNKKSPFKPDRNHIHHRMLRLGLSHLQTTSILAVVNLLFIGLAFVFRQAETPFLLMIFIAMLLMLNSLVNQLLNSKAKSAYPVSSLIS